jgi:putative redox protein
MSVTVRSVKNYQVDIRARHHQFVADEPAGVGDDTGPSPYELLLGALGACTVITIQMYARRKQWPLTGVEVMLDTYKIHARDCEDCVTKGDARVDVIECRLAFSGDLTPEQVARLTEIAQRCPVHRTLKGEVKIRTSVVGA